MHRPSRPHRILTAFLAALVLLWSQLALAAFVCPGTGHPSGAPAGAASSTLAMAERMAAGEPCAGTPDSTPDSAVDGMATGADVAQPALCHLHCVDAPQSAATAQPPVPTLPALVLAWPAPLRLAPPLLDAGLPAQRAARVALRPPPNPVFLSTLRVRV